MANTAFLLSSGLGSDGKSIRATKSQANHGFSAGSVIRFVPHSNGSSGDFKLAQASSGISAEAIGIVESVSASNSEFTVVYSGEIDTSNFQTASGGLPNGGGNTGSDVWFLDPAVAGGLTAYAPTSSGNVVKPVLTLVSGTDSDRGIVTNYVGTVVGGSNTVSLDTVHPVGEIIAFAGDPADVPTGWQLCDGSTLDASTYSKYYSRVGTKYGFHSEMVFEHRGHTGFAGGTGHQVFTSPSATVVGNALSWSYTNSNTGTVLLDGEPLIGITHGGETSTDNTGYPHGHIFANDRDLILHGHASGKTYDVSVATVKYVKTPDLRARTILGAGAAYGAFNGYTAGQVGGSEDADTVGITLGGGKTAYAAVDTGNANLRQPYMASNYIIRIDDTAQAALIDGVNVSLADSGLTDHDTATVANGDINVYDGTNSLYKPIKLLSDFPDIATFESKFSIRSDADGTGNGYVSIGHIAGDYPLHIKDSSPELRITRNAEGKYLRFYINSGGAGIATDTGHILYIGGGGGGAWGIVDNGNSNLTSFPRDNVDMQGSLGVTGDLTVKGTTKFQGQAYSPIVSNTDTGTFTPNFANGVVQEWTTTSASSITIGNPSDNSSSLAGGMYTLILQNTGGSTVTLTFDDEYFFANGIKPNIIRASSEIVISIVAQSSTKLLCTWAEDFS